MKPHNDDNDLVKATNAAAPTDMDWTQYGRLRDREVKAFDENGAISELQLKRLNGEFFIIITLAWQKQQLVLHTTRAPSHPRSFVDIRRAILWIDRQVTRCNLITLDLHNR